MEKGVTAEVLDTQNLRLGLCRIGIGLSSRYLLGTLMKRYLTMSKKGEDCLGKWKKHLTICQVLIFYKDKE